MDIGVIVLIFFAIMAWLDYSGFKDDLEAQRRRDAELAELTRRSRLNDDDD